MEQADIETQESVIRVVSPTDVQFKLDDQDKEEVIRKGRNEVNLVYQKRLVSNIITPFVLIAK